MPKGEMTTKDRLYLTDLLNLALINAKKAAFFSEIAAEDDVKEKIKDIESMFVQSYDELLAILEEELHA